MRVLPPASPGPFDPRSVVHEAAQRSEETAAAIEDLPSWQALRLPGSSPNQLTPLMAEMHTAIWACVDVIASAVASLPPRIYRDTGTEREEIKDHALAPLLKQPNPSQTWPDFMQWKIRQALLFGNALTALEPTRLQPAPWTGVQPKATRRGLLFRISTGPRDRPRVRTLGRHRVIHLKDISDDGYLGKSRLSRCADALGIIDEVQRSVFNTWMQGGFPSGAMISKRRLSDPQLETAKREVKTELGGPDKHGKIMVLDGDEWQWMPISNTPADTEMLETRRWLVTEAARIFQVPPPLLQDYERNTFTNAATAGRWFSTFTLTTWVRKFEAVFNAAMLPEGEYLELDMSAFTRADPKERWDGYKIALENDVLKPEEVKRMEGYE